MARRPRRRAPPAPRTSAKGGRRGARRRTAPPGCHHAGRPGRQGGRSRRRLRPARAAVPQAGALAIEDVRAGFAKYAEAQRAAVANSDAWRKAQVENQLAVKAAVLNVSDSLTTLGTSGAAAGDGVAAGAGKATRALSETADAADQASSHIEQFGIHAEAAGDRAARSAGQYQEAAFGLGSMSDAAVQALGALNHLAGQSDIWRNNFNGVMQEIQGQKDALAGVNAQLDKQMEKFDPLASKLATLRQQYKFVDDATLRSIAEKQQRLEEQQKSADEETQRKAEQTQRIESQSNVDANQPTAPVASSLPIASVAPALGASAGGGLLFTVKVEVVGGGNVDLPVAEDVGRQLLDALTRGQAVSQRKRFP
jgi:hypothetical protein